MAPITWRERLNREPRWQSMANWPWIDPKTLEKAKRKTYHKRREMIARVLEGEPIGQVAQMHDMSISTLTRLLSRALGGQPDERPLLTAACIPYIHAGAYQRTKSLPTLTAQAGGAGAFDRLLRTATGLKATLDDAIEDDLKQTQHAQRLSPQNLHKLFIHTLRKQQWPEDAYPFCHESLARESCRQYLHKKRAELRELKMVSGIKQRSSETREPERVLGEIQIDEQLLDVRLSLELLVEGQQQRAALTRVSLILAVDRATRCVLGFKVVYTKSVSAHEFLGLLDTVFAPLRAPEALSDGLTLPPEPWFPNQLGLEWMPPIGAFSLDNAMAHHAGVVQDAICDELSATLHLGRPASPLRRHLVERLFHVINGQATHRFPSTTGSHSRDPKREPDRHKKKLPVLTLEQLEHTLLVVLAEYNTQPKQELDLRTPIDYYAELAAQQSVFQMPASVIDTEQFFRAQETCRVHRSRTETRPPWVNVLGMRYTLCSVEPDVELPKQVTIRYDSRDVRYVQAENHRGVLCGQFCLPKSYRRRPLSLTSLRWLTKGGRDARKNKRDGVTALLENIERGKATPRDTTQLLRLLSDVSNPGEGNVDNVSQPDSGATRPWTRTNAFRLQGRKPG
ncbi:hypothetical protein [Parahalioglobus pacificus]|uniref:Integrase catalytic domain-containing protein n=1 Tax=Parahalioglobus pacificus TaxID=930806 RepID=A0A918XFD3_9GAMM|nr:hypothetical protein [Halioglobus pacificus]GHD29529.1 hypothetical protein GCM10007053_10230 [Halioglobus pacificus]